jgi:hypothetical protein
MKRFSMTVVFLLVAMLYCAGQIQVFPLTEQNVRIKKNSCVYYLPQTTLEVKLKITKETLIPGPYYKYAEKYLSIKNVASAVSSDISIDDVRINKILQPDPNACFMVVSDHEANIIYNSKGIIVGYNCGQPSEISSSDTESHFTKESNLKVPAFTDYGVKRNFIGNTDTTYKVVEIDSVFQKIPIYNTVIVSKDEEMKAEEAANYIIKIRKRLFKILTAQFDSDTPPADIEVMVSELKNMEARYLELFVGKITKQTEEYVFYYTPKSDLVEEKVPLCYITSDDEVVSQKTESSEPVYIVLKNTNATKEISDFYGRQYDLKKKEKNVGLYYRIPSEVTLSVDFDDFTYYKGMITVPQCGYLGHLPAEIFKNKNLKVEFDEKSGSIKAVYTK